jgi:crotonobetaine/carnitine-CoA ligase
VIRRRGENISAQDIEQLVTSHPDVVEAAAIGVASELTEQDVKVCVVVRPGSALTPSDVRRYCLEHGPAFMAPRYVELVTELPKTPTQKVEKFRLETDPHAPGTWDADAESARH